MQAVAVGWQLYALTGSALDLGLVGLVQFAPMILLTLVVGQVADRCDRRLVVTVCEGVKATAAATLAIGTIGGWQSKASLLAVVAILGAATAVFGLSTNFALSLVALSVLGAADVVSMVIRSSLAQIRTPDAMRGRASAAGSPL